MLHLWSTTTTKREPAATTIALPKPPDLTSMLLLTDEEKKHNNTNDSDTTSSTDSDTSAPPTTKLDDIKNKTKQLRYLEKEHEEFLRIELEIIALEDEIAAEKRLIKRYRTLLLLPDDTCDNVERQLRLSNSYQHSITAGWKNITEIREHINRLESTQRRLMSSRCL